MGVTSPRRHLRRARDDRAAALQRRAQRLQLLRLELELDAGDPRCCDGPAPRGGRAADPSRDRPRASARSRRGRSDRAARRPLGHEEVLAAVDRDDEVAALRELAEPRPLRRGPVAEAAGCPACTPPRGTPRRGSAARSPSFASAARGRAGTPPPRRATERAIGSQPAFERAPLLQFVERRHVCNTRARMPTAAILTIGNELRRATSPTRTARGSRSGWSGSASA